MSVCRHRGINFEFYHRVILFILKMDQRLDKSRYGTGAFKRSKSVTDNTRRFCYETRRFLISPSDKKAFNSFTKYLNRIKSIASGNHKQSRGNQSLSEMAVVISQDNLTIAIIQNIMTFPFEIRQEMIHFVVSLLGIGGGLEESLAGQMDMVFSVLIGYYLNQDISMITGQFLRDLIAAPVLHAPLLNMNYVTQLRQYALNEVFEVSSDAFETIKLLLTN